MEHAQPTAAPDAFEPRLGRSVSIEQAARLLGVCRRTIYNRIRNGRLQTIRTLGGSQRVLVESLHESVRPGGAWVAPQSSVRPADLVTRRATA